MMIQNKSVKLGLGVILSVGLSACNMMGTQHTAYDNSRNAPMPPQQHAMHQKSKPVQKTYASKDPTQKATPGPARKAAPQLPVIQ